MTEMRGVVNVEYLQMANQESLFFMGINGGTMNVTQHK